MPIAYLTLELRIEGAHSLKDKRQVVRSLKDRLRNSFNISIAEIDVTDLWQRATLGVPCRPDAERGTCSHASGEQRWGRSGGFVCGLCRVRRLLGNRVIG
jgi:hypothetical protein